MFSSLYKYYSFIFEDLLGIQIQELTKDVYHLGKIDLGIEDFFFMIIKKKPQLPNGAVMK